jgi:hypothetical protein
VFENRFLYPGGTDIVCREPTARILMLPGEDNPDLASRLGSYLESR